MSEQAASKDLDWALKRVIEYRGRGGLMPYQEGMIAMATEIERLRSYLHAIARRTKSNDVSAADSAYWLAREALAGEADQDWKTEAIGLRNECADKALEIARLRERIAMYQERLLLP